MIKVVCPSKGRWERVYSKMLFKDLILIVPNNEVDKYKEYNPDNEIIGHDEIGIVNTRNFLIKKFDEFFQVDDDVLKVTKNYTMKNELCSNEEIVDFIEQDYFISKEIGAKLFGFIQIINPIRYWGLYIFTNNNYIDPSACGFIKGHGLKYPKSIDEGEDYYIVCLNAYKNRYMLADWRISFQSAEPFLNKGGCQGTRTSESMLKNTKYLVDMFGSDVVKFKRRTSIKKNIKLGERTISIPI